MVARMEIATARHSGRNSPSLTEQAFIGSGELMEIWRSYPSRPLSASQSWKEIGATFRYLKRLNSTAYRILFTRAMGRGLDRTRHGHGAGAGEDGDQGAGGQDGRRPGLLGC